MRVVGRVVVWLVAAVAGLAGAAAVAVWLWPAEPPLRPPAFDAAHLPRDLDAWLAAREGVIPDIVPGTEKRIVWAGEPGAVTPLAFVYLHGFSASAQELRPVPERVAEALGANLYLARLAGHGRDGAAMGAASADDWMADFAEALAIAARLGERVVLMGTSTGATLIVAGLGADTPGAERVAGVVLVSANLALATAAGRLLDLPLAPVWVPWLVGPERGFEPINEAQAEFWTERYPTAALFPMARLMRAARAVEPGALALPALFVWSDADRVVDAGAIRAAAEAWGGPVTRLTIDPGPGIDPFAHVVAGDILSPAATDRVVAATVAWARGLP